MSSLPQFFVVSASVCARAGPALSPRFAPLTRAIASASRFGQRRATCLAARLRPKDRACCRTSASAHYANRERIHPRRASSPPAKVFFSATQTVISSSSRPNLKYEYEAQVSSCLGAQASRSLRLAEPSFSATGRTPHRRPNPPIERTLSGRLRLPPRSAHVAR
jgi:hypothetical protein